MYPADFGRGRLPLWLFRFLLAAPLYELIAKSLLYLFFEVSIHENLGTSITRHLDELCKRKFDTDQPSEGQPGVQHRRPGQSRFLRTKVNVRAPYDLLGQRCPLKSILRNCENHGATLL